MTDLNLGARGSRNVPQTTGVAPGATPATPPPELTSQTATAAHALFAIQQEWNSTRTLAQRMDSLRSGAGPVHSPLGIKLKAGETVFDDTHVDTLFGGSDLDWFFLDVSKDKLKDLARQELIA